MFLEKKIQKLSRNYLLQFSLKMKQLTDTWCTHQIAFNHSNLNLTWILRFVLKLSGALHQNVFRISSSRYSTVQRGHIRLTQKRLSEIAKKKKTVRQLSQISHCYCCSFDNFSFIEYGIVWRLKVSKKFSYLQPIRAISINLCTHELRKRQLDI